MFHTKIMAKPKMEVVIFKGMKTQHKLARRQGISKNSVQTIEKTFQVQRKPEAKNSFTREMKE